MNGSLHPELFVVGLVIGAGWIATRYFGIASVFAPLVAAYVLVAESGYPRWTFLVVVAGAAVGGLAARRWPTARSPVVDADHWTTGAAVAAFVYFSVPDTEGPVLMVGIGTAGAIAASIAPRWIPASVATPGAGALVGLIAAVTVTGSAGRLSWSSWWVAKVVVIALAGALMILTTARARRWPVPRPARPS